ncbi:MAG: gliding motility-associated C-terminal domain-containing protein [Flammeovirgaceae bacterium]|nr:gliding motility-associated C-terminal domain-containing protein [Flammeovirgaceae bacterium]
MTFRITITVYTDRGSEINFGDGTLDFGDGSDPHITPTVEETNRPDLGPEIGIVVYTIEHTYAGPGKYIISYLEPNRNAGILNMFNSVDTRFYVESEINIDPFLGCNNSPVLLVPPIDKACSGVAWFHNAGAYDPDGDSLSYELTIPKKEKNQNVDGYKNPNHKDYYDLVGINYNTANEDGNGQPEFTIHPSDGTVVWDAPGAKGEYNIAFVIKEWRKINDVWVFLGYVTRDMQIIVDECTNDRPELLVPPDICVEAGTTISFDIFASDQNFDPVQIEVFSEVLGIQPSPASYTPNPPVFQNTAPGVDGLLTFTWATKCEHVKDQSYQVVFKVTDKPASGGTKLVDFKTWNITVVGPPPQWNDVSVDLGTRSATLQWDNYVCSNAETMQVWRRVDQFTFTPPECVTGMPQFLGFTKIAEVPISTSTYMDNNGGKGLAAGARYCYRLVAVFPSPAGGESYVSSDTCIAPILADAPVITNVSVTKTNNTNGEITVKWRSPFDISKIQFPPPYSYEVYRSEGFSGTIKITKPHPGRLSDSTYVDTGLNSENVVYNYRIVAYDNIGTPIDTSSSASSVRLDTKAEVKKIELSWNADVPWSNFAQDYPYHRIYRGPEGATESQLVLIDSVNVTEKFYNYVDSGQYNNTPLVETEVYCYRVMTRGVYGNPDILEPLINFSQIICAQPNDQEPPCSPVINVTGLSCADYFMTESCSPNTFSNTLTWDRPEDVICRADIKAYNIYVAFEVGSEFELYVQNVTDTFYIDSNLPSYARCYKVSALDRSGNESELSEAYCFDNCPYYELPNVFTPNGDLCNDLFSAFSDRIILDENGEGPCGTVDLPSIRAHCARFVTKVQFSVLNRWGKEIYSYESGGERSIYIDWDGRDNNGNDLAAAVYYYVADVTFDVVDPANRSQTIKGWVQLIR